MFNIDHVDSFDYVVIENSEHFYHGYVVAKIGKNTFTFGYDDECEPFELSERLHEYLDNFLNKYFKIIEHME